MTFLYFSRNLVNIVLHGLAWVLILTMTIGAANASSGSNAFMDNSDVPFDATTAKVDKTTITWRKVDNLQAECEKESKRRGLGGFGYGVEACAFWDKSFGANQCTIITKKRTTPRVAMHEVGHCFYFSYHN